MLNTSERLYKIHLRWFLLVCASLADSVSLVDHYSTGGADSTMSAIESFLLAMVNSPELQLKAQEEIDRVVGRSRLPDFSDEADLPYLSAVVKEVLRFVGPIYSCCVIITDVHLLS